MLKWLFRQSWQLNTCSRTWWLGMKSVNISNTWNFTWIDGSSPTITFWRDAQIPLVNDERCVNHVTYGGSWGLDMCFYFGAYFLCQLRLSKYFILHNMTNYYVSIFVSDISLPDNVTSLTSLTKSMYINCSISLYIHYPWFFSHWTVSQWLAARQVWYLLQRC